MEKDLLNLLSEKKELEKNLALLNAAMTPLGQGMAKSLEKMLRKKKEEIQKVENSVKRL